LTNVARYAPSAATSVVLRYGDDRTSVSIQDRVSASASARPNEDGLAAAGGGHGLAGLRERLERAGGTMQAGPTENGGGVDLDVPAWPKTRTPGGSHKHTPAPWRCRPDRNADPRADRRRSARRPGWTDDARRPDRWRRGDRHRL